MLAWLSANWGTILVLLIVIGIVALSVRTMIRDKKKGCSSCGGNCGHCAAAGMCHSTKKK